MRLVDWLTCRNGVMEKRYDADDNQFILVFIARRDNQWRKYVFFTGLRAVDDLQSIDDLYHSFASNDQIPDAAIQIDARGMAYYHDLHRKGLSNAIN